MTEQSREPTVLDLLNNSVTSDRSVKKMLLAYAKTLLSKSLEAGFNEKITRDDFRKELGQWLHSRGFTGRGTKTLIDKTAAKVLKGYESKLRLRLMAKATKLANEGSYGETRAKAIRSALARGQVGKGRDRWRWYR